MKLPIYGTIGYSCETSSDGKELFEKIKEALNNNETIILDFYNVGRITPNFLVSSIGELLTEFGKDELKSKLFFQNLSDVANEVFSMIHRDKTIGKRDKIFKDSVDFILKQEIKSL
jgi:hypothetical protein